MKDELIELMKKDWQYINKSRKAVELLLTFNPDAPENIVREVKGYGWVLEQFDEKHFDIYREIASEEDIDWMNEVGEPINYELLN